MKKRVVYVLNRFGENEIISPEKVGYSETDYESNFSKIPEFEEGIEDKGTILEYWSDDEGTGRVVVNENVSDDQLLADLERIDSIIW